MARTTAAKVKAIIDWDSSIDLDAFIEVANSLVTGVCTDSGYSDSELTILETWLSAHFYTIDDQHIAEEKVQSATSKYQYKVDLALNVTTYGQQAMVIDHAGSLAQLNKRIVDGEAATVSINWLGHDYTTADPDD